MGTCADRGYECCRLDPPRVGAPAPATYDEWYRRHVRRWRIRRVRRAVAPWAWVLGFVAVLALLEGVLR